MMAIFYAHCAPPVVMRDRSHELSSCVHVEFFHWERVLVVTNHPKKPDYKDNQSLKSFYIHKSASSSLLCKAVFQARPEVKTRPG